jgi:hypothetical protein
MKNKTLYFLLAGLIVVSFFINSCKKTDPSNIPNLLTTGVWQLASLQVDHFVGDSRMSTDSLTCDTTQLFTFNKDNTCTYTNYGCRPQPTAKGTWALTSNKLYLSSDIVVQDTTATGKSQPFLDVQLINLGQFSLAFNTGDIGAYYTSTQVRTIKRYGFIRQKTTSN